MKRRVVLGLATIFAVAAATGVLLALFTDILKPTVRLTIDNRATEEVFVSVNDEWIGCYDTRAVAPGAREDLKMRLDGNWLLCLGTSAYTVGIRLEDRRIGWCYWPAESIIVYEDFYVDC